MRALAAELERRSDFRLEQGGGMITGRATFAGAAPEAARRPAQASRRPAVRVPAAGGSPRDLRAHDSGRGPSPPSPWWRNATSPPSPVRRAPSLPRRRHHRRPARRRSHAHPALNATFGSGELVPLTPLRPGLRGTGPARARGAGRFATQPRARLHELAAEVERLVDAGHAGTMAPEDLRGGSFTITRRPAARRRAARPRFLNTPQVAILGVHRVARAACGSRG